MYKLICFDMDGVLFESRNFWVEVHKAFGTLGQGLELTGKYLRSDYAKLVEEVVGKLWKGKDAKPFFDLIESYQYLEGVPEVFTHIEKMNAKVAIVSASGMALARKVKKDFGVDYIFANELVIKDNKVFGEYLWPVGAGGKTKGEIVINLCNELGISTKEAVYIGDSRIDIDAFKEVGLAIAFNSESEELNKVADVIVNGTDLSKIISHLQ